MNKRTISRSHAKSQPPDDLGLALEHLAEEFSGRARVEGDHAAAAVAIGLGQLALLWRRGSAEISITIGGTR